MKLCKNNLFATYENGLISDLRCEQLSSPTAKPPKAQSFQMGCI